MPVTDQKTDRQDITDLKPQAIYESPSRRRVWVGLLNESSTGLFIKTMWHWSAAAPLHSLWDLLWLWGFATLTSSRGSAKHKRTTTNNNMAQRRLDEHNAPFYGHYTAREICHFENSASSYHWMNLAVMRQSTLGQLSDSQLSQTRGR